MTPIHLQQEKAVEMLKDWSKWGAGLNFGAGAGCIVMLQQGVSSAVRFYIVAAIFCFAISILISSLIFALLPSLIQTLPINKKLQSVSIYDFDLLPSITLRHVVITQFAFFVLGVLSLVAWVLLKL